MRKTILLILIFSSLSVFSQEKELKKVSLDKFLTEIQFSSDNPDAMEMIWWIPSEFWEVSFSQDDTVSDEDIKALKDVLNGYELFAVVKGKIGYFGGITYDPIEEILKQLKVTYKENELMPVKREKIPSDLLNFLSAMQPMMANMFGTMGENMHFIIMQDDLTKTVLPINPTGNDTLKIVLDDFTKEVNLPLSSLLKERECLVDNELHSGKWQFCPYHGKKLVAQ